MKWIKTHEPKLHENYLEVHYNDLDEETRDVIAYLEAKSVLMGRNGEESRLVRPDEIYYIEIVDRRCYAYLKDEVWELKEGLSELTKQYEAYGFVRIGKSIVVNIYKVRRIKADFNMRMNLILLNEETIVMNRSYRNDFFRKLKSIRMEEK